MRQRRLHSRYQSMQRMAKPVSGATIALNSTAEQRQRKATTTRGDQGCHMRGQTMLHHNPR